MSMQDCCVTSSGDVAVAQFMVSPWEEAFEWLSIQDLHSMAQISQRMQHICGIIFRENYSMEYAHFGHNKKFSTYFSRMSVDIFREYIQSLCVDEELTLNDCQSMGLIGDERYKSLKCIELCYVTLTVSALQAIKDKLDQVQSIKLKYCEIEGGDSNVYEHLLKLAPKMSVLRVEACFKSQTMIGIGNSWLCHQYPELQHIDLRGIDAVNQIDELVTFFRQNPKIVKFELNDKLFRSNRQLLLQAIIYLNVLVLELNELKPAEFSATRDQLNELYQRHFYRKLHLDLRIQETDEVLHIRQIGLLKPLERVFLWTSENTFDGNTWPEITTLRELHLRMWNAYHPLQNMETLAIKLANLQRITFDFVHSDTVFTCVSKVYNLISVTFLELVNVNEENINSYISLWNQVRRKLRPNRLVKVKLYVLENYYLAAKWALKQNLSHLEVRRSQ